MNQKQIQTIDDIEFKVALKAISYCRVSSDDQADYGTSLDKQRRVNEEYAAKHDIEIIETIDDDFSGRKLDRPGFNRVRNYLKPGVANCLIVYDATRLSRHRTHTLMIVDELQELGCELHLSTKGRVDLSDNTAVLMLSIEGHISHNEVDRIIERMMDGKIEKTKQGQIMGAIAPFGYDIKRVFEQTPHGRMIVIDRQLELNPVESLIVAKAFELYATGEYSLTGLSQHLNSQGHLYRKNRQWNQIYLRRVLRDPVYTGRYQYTDMEVSVPAIVDIELWKDAQTILDRNKERLRRNKKYDYLFTQRVTCYHCKNAMSGRSSGKNLYYGCGASLRGLAYLYKDSCQNKYYFC